MTRKLLALLTPVGRLSRDIPLSGDKQINNRQLSNFYLKFLEINSIVDRAKVLIIITLIAIELFRTLRTIVYLIIGPYSTVSRYKFSFLGSQ